MSAPGGRALEGLNREQSRKTYQTPNARDANHGSQTMGAKLHRSKGKQPGSPSKAPKCMLSVTRK